ncbi:CYTH domain-containing protein [Listeria ivanovii]|uniref:Putative YjbK protein n=1 Tax=Listeria ivanovii (strain ATCC BAA-678 / PAM 55) TaxID=881621 RepID=G2ZE30_LISIP|nr:CYTH domain-containing protein [Listeria ivanovii]AHI55467.1 adenylate cyclase [Listeria ivanovii WSLC3009]AIS64923.1 adenylate cyclase [Listeria ivanovii subsp. ivanovii]MBC1758362.1 CYTH domain-containing protein [Listeria ivanovii]MBK3913238.1 CYTH domain-containing protein [Listeria ivanovii subsp. ivanovii]MBK3920645.1 CYTH domain-containing protein [Listeria ivanovii subsp. ivanovii]
MVKELEIEFRNLLTQEEYTRLIDAFHIKEDDYFEQTNYYLDTAEFGLKERQSALRIRKLETQYQLTLKTPEARGLMETTQILGADQATAILYGANIPVGPVRDTLKEIGINHEDLKLFGSLKTIRAEKDYKKGLLVLDKNFYGTISDFDLEYEVADYDKGKEIFTKLLKDYQITDQPAENKVARFYNHVYRNNG